MKLLKTVVLTAVALVGWAHVTALHCAPFTPASDAEVVEHLPNNDPAVRRVDSLRKQLAARPNDTVLRIDLARRYFDLSMALGDPRYVGYAAAALAPLAAAAPLLPRYWATRGMLQQYSHDFEAALDSLARSSALDPTAPEPLAWQAAIHMAQAHYPQAQSACAQMVPLAEPLVAQGCLAYVQASTGGLTSAYALLQKALAANPAVSPELTLWTLTRLGEMAWRLQRFDLAEAHFRQALGLGLTDQFLLAAYADFLLRRNRPAEVITLLSDWERSDVLLLRLALAGHALADPRAAGWASQLRDRFQAASQRGDRLHEQEAARFALDLERQPRQALELARRNYQVQKEPRDAEILLRSALAASDVTAAQPALDWLRASAYEDPVLTDLAAQLVRPGGVR